ncbi:MAG TPA: hypothetical protein VH986_13505 [Acidimicrobiia bacterium]|jgi:hypothetical protein
MAKHEKKEPKWQPPPSARELVETRLEPGEPIEAFVRVSATGLASEPSVATAVGVAAVGTLGTSLVALHFLQSSVALAVTDRRVFFVRDASRTGVRIEPKKAVRVLEYGRAGTSLRLWLNVDGHQVAYRIPVSLRAATDAFVHALGGAPPARTYVEDR